MRKTLNIVAALMLALAAFPLADALRASFETGTLGDVAYGLGMVPREGPPSSP